MLSMCCKGAYLMIDTVIRLIYNNNNNSSIIDFDYLVEFEELLIIKSDTKMSRVISGNERLFA